MSEPQQRGERSSGTASAVLSVELIPGLSRDNAATNTISGTAASWSAACNLDHTASQKKWGENTYRLLNFDALRSPLFMRRARSAGGERGERCSASASLLALQADRLDRLDQTFRQTALMSDLSCPGEYRFIHMPDGRCITAVTKSCFATLEDCIPHGKDGSSMQVWTATFSEAANGHVIESPAKRAERLCYDERPTRCRKWGASGECRNNPDFMRVTCRKTCGACVESPGCSVWSSSALESVLMRASGIELRAPVLRMVPPPDSRGRGSGLAINMTAWASSHLFPGHYHLSHQRALTHVHGAKATVTVGRGAGTFKGVVQKVAGGEDGPLCLAGGVSSLGARAAELNYAVWEGCESTELRGLPFQVWRAECVAPPPKLKPKPPPVVTGGTQRIVATSGGRTTVTSRTTITAGTSATASVTMNVNAQNKEVEEAEEEEEEAAAEEGSAGAGGPGGFAGGAAAWPQQQRKTRAAPVASAVSKRAAKLDALVAREGLTAGAEALKRMPPWQLLGVERDAAPDEVRAAFRALSRHFHPDKTTASDATLVIFRALQRAAHEMRDPTVAAESAARFEASRACFTPPHLSCPTSAATP